MIQLYLTLMKLYFKLNLTLLIGIKNTIKNFMKMG